MEILSERPSSSSLQIGKRTDYIIRPLTLALFSHLSNWRPQGMSGEYEDENGDRRRARASPLFTFHLSMGGGKGWREGRGTGC